MPKPRDKRRRNDLDAFVLALIESGVSTPYDLQQQAGLSPGATIPSLGRLLEAGYVRQTKPEARGRVAHKVTAAGKRYLSVVWRELLDDGPSGNLESDLRVALLAESVGGEPNLATEFLRISAAARIAASKVQNTSLEATGAPTLAALYSDLRRGAAKLLIRAEGEALLGIVDSLPGGTAANAKGTKTMGKPKRRATTRSKMRQ